MAKIESVTYRSGERSRVLNVIVAYENGDVRNFPGDSFRSGTLPDDVKEFASNAKYAKVILLNNGNDLRVLHN